MHTYRIGDAAALLGVSADTVRRLVDGGSLTAERDEAGRRIIPGPAPAAYARQLHRMERARCSGGCRDQVDQRGRREAADGP
ncbi:MerR family DNA-binding transcriptional regulator [Streptomyces cinereospinus]|uniref:MerR family DNA-binding transcriptional regulator n=1 Tax=Streptomyces cinereospinus TaxID=285561 RepID=A0ABV5N1Y0_9ACTN